MKLSGYSHILWNPVEFCNENYEFKLIWKFVIVIILDISYESILNLKPTYCAGQTYIRKQLFEMKWNVYDYLYFI